MLGKLYELKKFLENNLPGSNVAIPNLITRTDTGKAFLTVIKINERLRDLQMDIIDNAKPQMN